jgi:hypothetical protein
MSNRPATFRQVDISRAVRGATAAGLAVGRVEIDPTGKIVLVAATEPRGANSDRQGDTNEWDEVLK